MIPNLSVYNVANSYLKAAERLQSSVKPPNDGDISCVSCILAAFSVELLLKSFLVEETISTFTDSISDSDTDSLLSNSMTFLISKVDVKAGARKHDLKHLFDLIGNNDQADIIAESQKVDPSFNLDTELIKYKDHFAKKRYIFDVSEYHISDGVFNLAKHMQEVVKNIGESRSL